MSELQLASFTSSLPLRFSLSPGHRDGVGRWCSAVLGSPSSGIGIGTRWEIWQFGAVFSRYCTSFVAFLKISCFQRWPFDICCRFRRRVQTYKPWTYMSPSHFRPGIRAAQLNPTFVTCSVCFSLPRVGLLPHIGKKTNNEDIRHAFFGILLLNLTWVSIRTLGRPENNARGRGCRMVSSWLSTTLAGRIPG